MSRKHRKHLIPEQKIKINNYEESKHTRNEYKKFLAKATHIEILKEYNKLLLLMNMMKHKGTNSINPYPDREKKQDNIDIVKYKYNLICQVITQRNYMILKPDYKRNKNVYKSK